MNILTVIIYIFFAVGISIFFTRMIKKMIHETYQKRINLPRNLSMGRDDFPILLECLERIYNCKYVHVIIDFSYVKLITPAAYMVVMAQVEKTIFKKKINPQMCVRSNNLRVLDVMFLEQPDSKIHHTHFNFDKLEQRFPDKSNQLEPQITNVLERRLKTIGIIDYFEFNTLVTELIGNAIEHGINNKDINWWLHHRFDRRSNSIKIAFVDMGTGIVNSYRKAGLAQGYSDKEDKQIIIDALDGVLGSSTGKENRGRGLPQIKRMVMHSWISDFILITNRVSVRYIDGTLDFQEHSNFVGTFYSFSINRKNFEKWKKELTSQQISA